MSHQIAVIPWPSIPSPRTQAEADEFWDCGGASPSRADEWQEALATIAANPEGCPLPEGWSVDGTTIQLDISQGGRLCVTLRRVVRVGEGEEEGKTWGESCGASLTYGLPTVVREWTSGETAAERLEFEALLRRQNIIGEWANSASACTIAWGNALDGRRRDIADCLDALSRPESGAHPRRSLWVQTVQQALSTYPVAAPGLARVIATLGLAGEIGVIP